MDIISIFGYLIGFLISLSFHEWAHAYAAFRYGDRTAQMAGRLTLNPVAHIDPIGTIILPLAGMFFGLPILGWAKPVPVNLNNIAGDRRAANMVIAFAGPAINLILCALLVVCYYVFKRFDLLSPGSFFYPLEELMKIFIFVNSILAFFNLIPIPPLDGGAILSGLLPEEYGFQLEAFLSQFGFVILMILLISGGLSWISTLSMAYINMIQYGVGLIIGIF